MGDEESETEANAEAGDEARKRLTTIFGWVAGGALGVLVNFGIAQAYGLERYPTTWTTFVLFLAGAFGGLTLADRLGPRGFKPLGIAAGVLFTLFAGLVITALL